MKKFIIKIFKYFAIFLLIIEMIIRLFSLTNDVPQRDIDEFGLQVFLRNQNGISHGNNWRVNENGFLGHNDVNGQNQILIIGDSFIENIMNPFDCRQSSFFKNKGYDVFEIGRSGISFIEALEFYSKYRKKVNPQKTIFFVDSSDFRESIVEINKFEDRTQISLVNSKIFLGKIKAKYLKKILYNYKTLYFTYVKYLKSKKTKNNNEKIISFTNNYSSYITKLIEYANNKYDLKNCLFAFRGRNDFKEDFLKFKINFMELNLKNKEYRYSEKDSHWNCAGHKKASKLILENL